MKESNSEHSLYRFLRLVFASFRFISQHISDRNNWLAQAVMKMDSLLLEKSPFHNPQLKLSDENKEQTVREAVKDLILPVSKLEKVIDLFTEELNLGLEANPSRKSVFYCSNTFVTEFPDGSEEGDILSMDLGNTNLRVILTRLRPGEEPEFRVQAYEMDEEYRRGKPKALFDFLAVCIEDFLNKNEDIGLNKPIPFGFTFSFGYDQLALDQGIISKFSIATDLAEAVGKDAVQYIRDAIAEKGLNVDVVAIVNDTTSTLVYGMSLKPDTQIGFIIGSGTNTCYLESVDRLKKIDPMKTFGRKVDNVIINLENGLLGDNGSMDFAKSQYDFDIDEESLFPHSYSWEKLLGGYYFGDLVRRCLLSLAKNNAFLSGIITDELKRKESIRGQDVSSVESDKSDSAVNQLLERLGYSSAQITSDDIRVVRYVCALIGVRGALIAAANLAAMVRHMDKPFVRIAADGSLYKKHPKLHTLITDFLKELVPNHKFEIFLADDGSGKGSAFIAAVAAKNKQKS